MGVVLFLSLIIIVLLLSGVLSCTEASLLSVSYSKACELEQNSHRGKKKKAKLLLKVKNDLAPYISAIVILNNIVNIIGSIYIGIMATGLFGTVYLGIVSAVLTFLIIIFAEIIPKLYGEKHCVKISLFMIRFVTLLKAVFTPILFLLNKFTSFIIKDVELNHVSEDEIKAMANLGQQQGSINKHENLIISNAFKLDETTVYDIMVPKGRVSLINIDSDYDSIVQKVEETGFTRFPVEYNSEIIGLLNVKDLLKYYNKKNTFSVKSVLRPILYAPDNIKINVLEDKFRFERSHMAMVVNEHGDYIGIVTLEDVIEEVLGEIEDEFDKKKEVLIRKIDDLTFNVSGSCDLEYLEHRLGINITNEDDETKHFTTLNGFLIDRFTKMPQINDSIIINNITLRVIRSSKKKIIEVEIKKENVNSVL